MKRKIVAASIVGVTAVSALLFAYRASHIQLRFDEAGFSQKSDLTQAQKEFESDLELLQLQVEEALAWRTSALNQISYLNQKVDKGTPLSAEDLRYLHEGVAIYLEFRNEVLALAHKHKHFVGKGFKLKWAPGEGTHMEFSSKNDLKSIQLDPTDEQGDLLIRQFKLSLASALVLYDNFLLAIWPYQDNPKLRTLINHDNTIALNGLRVITDNYLNIEYRLGLARAVEYFNAESQWRMKQRAPLTESHDYLNTLILGSPTLQIAKKSHWVNVSKKKFKHLVNQHTDALKIFQKESLNVLSGLFGNAVGLVEIRKGKLYELNPEKLSEIKSALKPLDILLEKTPFRLTDKLIPGHYGHVAIWLGTEKELKTAKLWDHPLVVPHQDKIKEGYHILEALRSGVQLSRLESFLNVDDLAVVRPRGLSVKEQRRSLQIAFEQIGKAYDFNFDIETDKKIVCSELAYVVFPQLSWPIEKAVGRYTISPDHVANLVVQRSADFEIPLLVHDGSFITDKKHLALKQLLAGNLIAARGISSNEGL